MNNEKVKCPDCKGKGNAAERVRNGMPTYSNVPSGLKYLRRVPILGGFTSFPWEIGRNLGWNVKYMMEDMRV